MVQLNRYERRQLFGLVAAGASDVGDWVCQRCGRAITLHPTPWIWTFAVIPAACGLLLGLLFVAMGAWMLLSGDLSAAVVALAVGGLLAAVCGGVVGTFAWPGWVRLRNPVVPDAEVPEVRFVETVARRRCGCGRAARCVEVTANTVNYVYTGTEYGYRCECGREFTVESPLSMLFAAGGSAFLMGAGWVCVPAAPTGWGDWVISVGLLGLGAGWMLLGAWRALARLRFPAVSPE